MGNIAAGVIIVLILASAAGMFFRSRKKGHCGCINCPLRELCSRERFTDKVSEQQCFITNTGGNKHPQ